MCEWRMRMPNKSRIAGSGVARWHPEACDRKTQAAGVQQTTPDRLAFTAIDGEVQNVNAWFKPMPNRLENLCRAIETSVVYRG